MAKSLKGLIKLALILLLTAGVVCSCCSCAIESDASTKVSSSVNDNSIIKAQGFDESCDCSEVFECLSDIKENETTYKTLKCYSSFLSEQFSHTIITRYDWLKLLLPKLGYEISQGLEQEYPYFVDDDYFEGGDYFLTAIKNKIIGKGGIRFDQYCPATRQYVSTTLINAAHYPKDYTLECEDYRKIEDKKQAAASVYLGFIELDENGCFDPYGKITQEQVDFILNELDILNALKGKTVMSFGDSIMYGSGNDGEGVADLMEKRYQMKAIDYAVGGATFGYVADRVQISNQILTAIKNHDKADIILLNGGTNDMRKVKPGQISDNFEYGKHGRVEFAQGMEYALGLLKDNYPDTPVVYVRAHDMVFSLERNELHYGKMALDICSKWDITVADIFTDTDFDAHNRAIRNKYTVHTEKYKNGDSIHPNRTGYYKYYLPLTTQRVLEAMDIETE